MVGGNSVPGRDEIQRPDVPAEDVQGQEEVNGLADEYLRTQDRRVVNFVPQDTAQERQQIAGSYDRSLGYDRIAVGNSTLSKRIDDITNLLAHGENTRSGAAYKQAWESADRLMVEAGQGIISSRPDYQGIANAKSPEDVLRIVEQSITRQQQALQQQRQQETDPARQRRLDQLLVMEQERAQNLRRMAETQDPAQRDRLLMYDAMSAERIDLSHKMMNETDANKVRQMAQAEMNLHTVQRAPGFTRANYGMLMMREGDPQAQQEGLMHMKNAAYFDPEMVPNPATGRRGDANFMRVASEITGIRPDDPRFAQVLAPVFNIDANANPTEFYKNYRPTQLAARPVEKGAYNPADNPAVRYAQTQEQPYYPGGDGATRDQTRVADRPVEVPLVNGKTPYQRVQELGQVYQQQGLTPELRQAYAAAIADSDKGISPRVATLQAEKAGLEQKATQLAQQIQAVQESPEVKTLVQQGMAKLQARPEAERAQLKTLTDSLKTTQDPAQREKILAEIGKVCPEFVQVTKMLEEKLKPFTDQMQQLSQQAEALEGELVAEANQSSVTRMEYAEKLMKSQDPQDQAMGKQLLMEAVSKSKPEQRESFANYAKQLGLSDAELQRAAQAAAPLEAQTQPGTTQNQQTGERSAAGKLIDQNKAAFDAAPDKKAALAQLQDSYKKAVADAEAEHAAIRTKQAELQTAIIKATEAMPAEDKAQLQKLEQATTPEAEKLQIQQAMQAKYPNIAQLADQLTSLAEPELDAALLKFEAKYEYARAANQGGDAATSKAMMEAGLKGVLVDIGPELAPKVLEDPGVAELVAAHKLNPTELFQQALTDAQQAGTNPGGDAGAGSLQEMLSKANLRMKNGDIAGAKQLYEQAIKLVDGSFNPEENNRKIKEAQDALESGKINGRDMTVEERVQKHKEIEQYFGSAFLAYDIRAGYARVLAHPSYKQNAAAETAYKDAIAAADRVPVEAMKRQVGLIANDVGIVQTAYEQATGAKKNELEKNAAFLNDFVNSINGQGQGQGPAADRAFMNAQINARKDLASFYVTLVTQVDANNQTIMKPDGTPAYIADSSQVFKPVEAMKAIDEAKAKYKALHGTDLDKEPGKDPTLALLAKGIYDNSPEELQRKYQNVNRMWDDAKASGLTLAAGIAVVALSMKFKPAARLLGAGTEVAAMSGGVRALEWGTALTLGSTAASGTRHLYMTQGLGRTDETWQRSFAYGTGLTLGAVGLYKVPQVWMRGFTAAKVEANIARVGAGNLAQASDDLVRWTAGSEHAIKAAASGEQSFVGLRQLETAMTGLQKEKALLTGADDAAQLARLTESEALLAKQIADSKLRTAVYNFGRKGKDMVDDFDVLMANAKPHERAAYLEVFLKNKETQNQAFNISQNASKYAGLLEQNGLKVTDDVAKVLESQGVNVLRAEGGAASIELKTIDQLRDVLPKLAKANPRLFGTTSEAKALTNARAMLDDLATVPREMMVDGKLVATPLKSVLETASMSNPGRVNLLKQLVPEASEIVGKTGRFAPVKQAFLDKQYGRMVYKAGEGTVLKAWDGATAPARFVGGLVRDPAKMTADNIGWYRSFAGATGGATFYAGNNYLPSWNRMYGENTIDDKTGKPYEFNLTNTLLRPGWKSTTDNIFISSIALGGLAAKPGQMLVQQAPWATGKLWWKPAQFAGGMLSGSTYNFAAGRLAPRAVSELAPMMATNMALWQWELPNNLDYRSEGQVYQELMNKQNEALTDAKPKTQEEIRALQQQQQQQQQEQQRQQQQQQQQGEGETVQGRPENELTNGAPK